MRPRWSKVISDLIDNKARTLLVVFSIAVGVFSVGVIAGTYVIISNDMSASYAANRPANIQLRTDEFDEDFLSMVKNAPGVDEVEGRRVFSMRVRPTGSSQWTVLDIVAIDNFEDTKINLLTPEEGLPFPGKRQVILERDALKEMKIGVGQDLIFELPDGSQKALPVVGLVQDPTTGAGDFLAPPYAYITMSTLTYLHLNTTYNRLFATVSELPNDDAHIRAVADDLIDRFEKSNLNVSRKQYFKTNEHPMASTVNAILGILGALGVLIVFLSSSLIANTLNALLNQHLRHIGVIKLVGGRSNQVFLMYLALILSFGVIALLISVPLGGQGAYALSAFIADKMSFTLMGYRIIPISFFIQAVIALGVPIIAGFVPVINGSRITILKAISGDLNRGEHKKAKAAANKGRLGAWLAMRNIHLPRPLLISLRNTFRRKGRLLLTLFTLTMGGAIFTAVFNVRVSLHDYIGQVGKYFLADATVDFDRLYRLSEVEQYAMQVPGVVKVEGWAFSSAEVLYQDDTIAENLTLLAPPVGSTMVSPMLISGRWLKPGDERALTISEGILEYFPSLKPGDWLRLKINGRDEDWQVVGLFKFIDREGIIGYSTYEYISRVDNLAGRSYSFRVMGQDHTQQGQTALSEKLDDLFRNNGFHIRQAKPGYSTMQNAVESLDILVTFLLIMALLTATVGSMGLAGTMGMNVLERTREIGIMRSIGATDAEIMRTVISEGMLIGAISWFLGSLLSFPFTYLLATIVSLAIFKTPIGIVLTVEGYVIWLGLVALLSVLASILPARNAARMTIREVLAYE
jgi:putative ABC transport system permease protein